MFIFCSIPRSIFLPKIDNILWPIHHQTDLQEESKRPLEHAPYHLKIGTSDLWYAPEECSNHLRMKVGYPKLTISSNLPIQVAIQS